MAVRDVLGVHAQADDRIGRLVSQVVDELGVPSTLEEVGAMAEVLDTGRELDALGFEFQPAFERLYPVAAVESMVSDAVGLGVQPNTIPLALLDDASRESARVGRVVPFLAADDPVVARVVRERIAATAARHVRAAGRQMVADTVEHGQARRAGSHEPVRIGFARVLSGRENCAFCAMLASRGAVCRKDTVVRRRDGRKYHNHCDCVARLVVHGQPWEGQEQADALFELYKDTVSKDADGRTDWLGFAEAWAQEVDKARFSPLGASEKLMGSINLNGVKPKPHELVTFNLLAQKGFRVELLPTSHEDGVKTPDCLVDGVPAEVKAPQGSGKNTIYQLLRYGSKQASHVIVDLHRSSISISDAIEQINLAKARYRRIERVTLITNERELRRF